MAQQPKVDDKYKSGIWYDAHAGEFCKIREVDDTIGLYEPDRDPANSDPYYRFDEDYDHAEDVVIQVEGDMIGKVTTEAVENPAAIVKRAVRMVSRNDPNELMSIPQQEAIDLRYARTQTEILEQL